MGDSVSGGIGEHGDGNAAGKGIQQLSVNLGDRSPQETAEILRELNRAVFGDGYRWDGIVRELRKLEERIAALTTKINTVEQKLVTLESRISRIPNADINQKYLRAILVLLVIISLIIAWAVIEYANGGPLWMPNS